MKAQLLLLPLLAALMAGSCSESPSGPANNPSNTANSVKFNVTWDPATKRLGTTELNSLRSIDSSNYTFVFGTGNSVVEGLQEGDVIAVGDYAIRRVAGVTRSGSTITITTEPATLIDAVSDADIQWDYGVQMTPEFFANAFRKAGITPTYMAGDSIGVSFKMGDLEHSISFKFRNEVADIKISTLKKIGGAKVAQFVCAGTLQKFRSKGNIQIKNRELETYEEGNNNLQADLTLSAEVAGSGDNRGINIELPILKFPIPNLPFFLFEIKCQVVLNAVVPADGASLLKVHFKYDADQGLTWSKGGTVTPRSSVREKTVEKVGDQRTGASGAIAVSWGLGFPRMSISFTGTTLGWIQPAYLIGGDYTAFPACQQAKATFIGSCGWGLGALGFTIASGSKTLWNEETVLLKAGQCP